jgi:hypothetical protein
LYNLVARRVRYMDVSHKRSERAIWRKPIRDAPLRQICCVGLLAKDYGHWPHKPSCISRRKGSVSAIMGLISGSSIARESSSN